MMTRALRLAHPAQAADRSIAFRASLQGERLHARFDVRAPGTNVNPGLPLGASQWGLWDWDVVEVFLSLDPAHPKHYYEFEISPLGQFVELEILEPRKSVNRDFHSGFVHRAGIVGPNEWFAEMEIPLKRLGWDGKPESVRGGAFAILDPVPKRTYWGLFLPQQAEPDFHLPEHFGPLLTG